MASQKVLGYVNAAQKIIDRADHEGRHLSSDEVQQVRDLTDQAELQKSVEQFGARLADGGPSGLGRGIGDYLLASDAWRSIGEGGLPESTTIQVGEYLGAAGDPVLESTGNNADGIPPQWLPGVAAPGLAQAQPSLAGLFAQGVTDSNAVRYMKVTTRTAPASAVTVESQQKPGAEFAFDDVVATLQKLAVFIPVSEEMYEDSVAVREYLNTQLPLMVRQAEDRKLASEIYVAATGVGLSTTIGGSDANGFDSIADAIKDVQVNAQVNPDAIFINPTDWWSLKVKKSTTSGDYYSGGPFVPGSSTPWGIPAVVSATAPSGFPLVGAFRQGGQVWRKGGVRLEVSNSHLDFFRTNTLALRAEVRVALAVYDPACFSVANLAS